MKKHVICLLMASGISLPALSTSALATGDNWSRERGLPARYTEFAEVVDVRPVYRDVRLQEPRQECWTEKERHVIRETPAAPRHHRNRHRERASTGDVIVGSVIGGVIGNQLGRGSRSGARTGATVAGAIVGGAIANETRRGSREQHGRHFRGDVRHERVYGYRPVERCKQVYDTRHEQRLQYYDVTYLYQGRRFTTRSRRDPGRRIELNVSLTPARQ